MEENNWNERDHPRDKNHQKFVKKGTSGQTENSHLTKTDFRDTLKEPSVVMLSRQEYAELCSAVRTRYADKIPKCRKIALGNYEYEFIYSKREERILCVGRVDIETTNLLDKLNGEYYDE